MAKHTAKRPQGKHWCFTINNPKDEDNKILLEEVEYMVVGNEVGNKGTKHWQGYVCFKNRKLLTAVKKLLPRAHLEMMRGTPQEAADYCKKDGDWTEEGKLPAPQCAAGGQAVREKWDTAKRLAIAGDIESIDSSIYIHHYNTLKRIKADHAPKIASIPTLDNEWHYGPTGTGKSRKVRELYPNAFIKDANRWWDGYSGEEVVIIEDIDKYDLKLGRYIKLWGDHYAFPADFKHQGKLDIRPKKIILTSNYEPSEIWCDDKTYHPIERRYKLVQYQLEEPTTPKVVELTAEEEISRARQQYLINHII